MKFFFIYIRICFLFDIDEIVEKLNWQENGQVIQFFNSFWGIEKFRKKIVIYFYYLDSEDQKRESFRYNVYDILIFNSKFYSVIIDMNYWLLIIVNSDFKVKSIEYYINVD